MAEHWRERPSGRAGGWDLVDLPPQPSFSLPRWVALVAVFAAGALTMAIVIGLTNLLADDAPEANLLAAYDRGFAQGGRAAEAPPAAPESGAFARGFAAARRLTANSDGVVIPAFSLSPFIAFAVPLGNLDRAYLAGCPSELPGWLLALHGVTNCTNVEPVGAAEGAAACSPGLAILPPCR